MKKIISSVIKQPVTVLMLTLLLIFGGVVGTLGMPIQLIPDMQIPIVSVVVTYPGASAATVEDTVTNKVADAVGGVGGVEQVYTYSYDNVSAVMLEFGFGVSLDDKMSDVRDHVSALELPDGCSEPEVTNVDLNGEATATLYFTAGDGDVTRAADEAERFADLLAAIDGVGSVELDGEPSHGVTTMTVASLALFAVLFSAFLLYERRQTVQVLRLRLFRSGRFVAVSVSFLILNACYMGCLYLLPYFMRVELGFDTIMCGIMLLIAAVMTLIFCLKVGRMADLRGNRPFVIAGCFLMVVAMTIFAMMSADVPLWVLVVGVAVLGTVWGVAGGPVGSRLIENVPSDERGSGSSVLSFFIYFGSALGTALFSGLFGFGSASAGQPIAGLDPAVFMDGFSFAMAFGVALAVIGLITAVAVNERRSA